MKDPLRRSRRLKRNRFVKRFMLLGAGVFFAGALVVGFFHIPYFAITSVSIEGTKTIPAEHTQTFINSYLQEKEWGLLPHKNFFVFLFASENLAGALQNENPKIKTVTFKKRFPHGITASFEERAIWATTCKGSLCFYMDKEGVLFGKSSRISGSVFFAIEDARDSDYALGGAFMDPSELGRVRTLLEAVESISNDSFESLAVSGSEELIAKYEATTKRGWKIIFDSKTNNEIAVANFSSAYEGLLQKDLAQIEYVDLRLENKIFYKYKE